jgi:hypothetical protein
VPRRRGHNRYRQIYNQELSGGPLVAEGLPCGSCGFPMLSEPVEGRAGRWVHADCTSPPAFSRVAVHLIVHWAWELGEAAESLLERVPDKELESAVEEYLRRWHEVRRWAATQSRDTPKARRKQSLAAAHEALAAAPPVSRWPRLPQLRTESQPTARGTTSHPSCSKANASLTPTCHLLARRVEAAPPGRARIAIRAPTPAIAAAIAQLLGDLARTVIQQAQPVDGAATVTLCLGVAESAREKVIDRLTRYDSAT